MTKLGQFLIKKGKITDEQLEQAFRAQLVFGGRIGTTLIELGFITERDLGEALMEVLGVPFASLEDLQDVPASVIGLVPPNLAASYKVVPFRLEDKTLHMAMMTPTDLLVQDEISFLTELRVKAWVAPEIRILEALDRFYKVPRERRFISLSGELNQLRQQASKKPAPASPARPVAATPPPDRNEIGLDGKPVHDTPEPAVAAVAVATVTETGPAPQTLEDWRTAGPAPEGLSERSDSEADAGDRGSRSPAAFEAPAMAGSEPAPAPRPEAEDAAPTSLDEAADMLAAAGTRDRVAQILLGFSRQMLRRAGLFILQKRQVLSWRWSAGNDGGGTNGGTEARGISLSLDTPSLFTPFRSLKSFYLGPVAPLPANRELFQKLNAPLPKVAVVLPIPIQGKVTVLLYGDNEQAGMERIDLDALQRLARKASAALEILILKNKIRTL